MINWNSIKSYLAGIFQSATKQPQQPVEKAKIDITVGGLHLAMFPDRDVQAPEDFKIADILHHIAICKNKLTGLIEIIVKNKDAPHYLKTSLAIFEKLESDINNAPDNIILFDKDTLSLLTQNAHNIKAALAIIIKTQPSNITEVTIDGDTIYFPSTGKLNFLPAFPKSQMDAFDKLASWAKHRIEAAGTPSQHPNPRQG